MQRRIQRYLGSLVFVVLLCLSMALGATIGVLFVYNSDLPSVNALEDYPLSVITEVYSDDNHVIGSFALERRILVKRADIPKVLHDAIVSVEDQNFEEHWGIDIFGIARAGLRNLMKGRAAEGGSTLTQQLAKNMFLTPEKTMRRKIQEAMLSIQIERNYTKAQILEMYCNLVFMGHGQYGFAAAADFLFGKKLKDLTVEEAALLAALPRSPSTYSPILSPSRSRGRRDYALDRMVAEGKLSSDEGEKAKGSPIQLVQRERRNELAPYFVEELRQYLEKTYGKYAVHESGLKVYSTLNVEMQKAANSAVRQGLRDYDKRHGWRGATRNLLSEGIGDLQKATLPDWRFPVRTNDIVEGLVLSVSPNTASVRIADYTAMLGTPDVEWTHAKTITELLKPGDVALFKVRSIEAASRKIGVELEQKPMVQGALVAIDPSNGDVKALVGGYDFEESKFNRATQAMRQTGSVFKPFVYAAAVDQRGLKPDDIVVDSPVNFGGYSPGNYDGKYEGPITIRRAVAQSRNIPAVKTLANLGIDNLVPYLRRFGITSKIDPYLPTALGAADITLMEMTSAYTVFPNEGVRAIPRLILKVTDHDGDVLAEDLPPVPKDVIPAETARTMVELLQEPVRSGTATKLKEMNRPVAGKTGTTNDFTDAWFMGFTPSLTMGVWVGFDAKVTLGDKETGGKAALPIWFDAMQQITKGKPAEPFDPRETPTITGVVSGVALHVNQEPKGAQQ